MNEISDAQLIIRIIKIVKNATWSEIEELGINMQQAQKIRAGKPVVFRGRTLKRLRKKLAA